MNVTVSIGCFSMVLFGACSAWAQDFPNKTVRMVVPFAPGGATDVLARIVSQKLYERWGQIVLADNRVGAYDLATSNWVWGFREQNKVGKVWGAPILAGETVWLSTEKLGLIAVGSKE